uniref:Phage_integrase domain-containing protein n=1 Tax=Strongyloides papillosus TaxID=174720 RepID=A0A0N5BYU6_STREA
MGIKKTVKVSPKHVQLFDVQPILQYLHSVSPDDGLYVYGRKTLFLLMISTGGRISEFDRIRIRNLQFIENYVRVNLDLPTKTSRSLSFEIKAFDDTRLCPVFTLKQYIGLTKQFRNSHDEKFLFLKNTGDHSSATKSTLATWIKLICLEAGIQPINSHVIRKTVTSTMFFNGLSLQELCSRIRWKSNSTFLRFYNQDMLNFSEVMLSQSSKEDRM